MEMRVWVVAAAMCLSMACGGSAGNPTHDVIGVHLTDTVLCELHLNLSRQADVELVLGPPDSKVSTAGVTITETYLYENGVVREVTVFWYTGGVLTQVTRTGAAVPACLQ